MEDHNQVFAAFIEKNPSFANPEGHHRRLADWSYDTRYRDQVEAGDMTFEAALFKSRDEALETLPPPHEMIQTITGLTGYDRSIAEIAISRNQPIPPPSNRTAEPLGLVAQICAQRAGLKNEED